MPEAVRDSLPVDSQASISSAQSGFSQGGRRGRTNGVAGGTRFKPEFRANAHAQPGPSAVPQQLRSGLFLLTSGELATWDALVSSSPQASIFVKSWWLQATCGQAQVLGYFEAGKLVAGIPLYYERRMGIRLCVMPKLTQTMGVIMAPLSGRTVAQSRRETEILDLFAEWLSKETVFVQAFHPNSQNWLPFFWRGYTQTTHYTYVFDDLTSVSELWNGLDSDRRTNIRKARRLGVKVRECDAETVFQAASASYQRQGRAFPYTLEYLSKLYDAARLRDAGICMAATDSRGRVHAAQFFVWDAERGYGIAGGHDAALGTSGGPVLLTWSMVEFAAGRTAVFDFEGSMRKPIEASFRSFGARRVSYNRIVRMPRWLRIGLCVAGRVQI